MCQFDGERSIRLSLARNISTITLSVFHSTLPSGITTNSTANCQILSISWSDCEQVCNSHLHWQNVFCGYLEIQCAFSSYCRTKAWWRDYNSHGGVDVVSNTYSAQVVILHYIWSLLKIIAMNVEFCATYHHGSFHPPSFMAHLLNIIIISDIDS